MRQGGDIVPPLAYVKILLSMLRLPRLLKYPSRCCLSCQSAINFPLNRWVEIRAPAPSQSVASRTGTIAMYKDTRHCLPSSLVDKNLVDGIRRLSNASLERLQAA